MNRTPRPGHRLPSPVRFSSRDEVVEVQRRGLVEIGLDGKWKSRVGDLSHGQRQLLALRLAMARRPSLMLLDEHTASLDRGNAALCMTATESLWQESGMTILMVTHNLVDAIQFGSRLLVLRDGKLHTDLDRDAKRSLDLLSLAALCGYGAHPSEMQRRP